MLVAVYSGMYTVCLGAAGPGFCLAASAGLLAKQIDHRAREHENTVTCQVRVGVGRCRCLVTSCSVVGLGVWSAALPSFLVPVAEMGRAPLRPSASRRAGLFHLPLRLNKRLTQTDKLACTITLIVARIKQDCI